MKVIAYNHTHWDREWYQPFQEFRLRFVVVMDLIVQELHNGNIDCFYLDGQTVILEDYFELYPSNKPLIQELIAENKIIIGPWYALADEFLVSGESLFRNMLIGIKQAKSLGCSKFIGYLPDSFGHNYDIPRILSAFGINNAVLWRGAGSNKSEFVWKSQDDSSVIATYLIEGYFQNILHYDIPTEEKAQKLHEFLTKIKEYSASEYILLPVGGDHLGPVLNLKQQLADIQDIIDGFSFESGGISEYINKIKNLNNLAEHKGELRDNYRNPILPGTLSSRMYLKQENAASTWKLSKLAEPFYSFLCANNMLPQRKNELEYAWKLLLKNHTHDCICGCSIDDVHDEMMPRFKQVNHIADGLVLRAKNAVSSQVKNGLLWIYNASDYDFSGVINVKTNKNIPENLEKQFVKSAQEFPKEILLDTQRPPFSEDIEEYKEYLVYVENIKPHTINIINEDSKYTKQPDFVKIQDNFIRNSRIRLDINHDGTLKLTDLEQNKTFDKLHYIYNRADVGDTYNYSPLENDKPLNAKFKAAEILENGKLKSTLRLYYELDIPAYFDETKKQRSSETYKTVITTDISLSAGAKRVEFSTSWENKSKDHILQIKFKFDEKVTKTFAENTFGAIERVFNPDYSLQDNIPIPKGAELKTNTAPMQRFVWTEGLGVITKGLTEYGVSGNELYITALRCVGKLSKLSMNTRNFPAGPPLDTDGAQCIGNQKIEYALCLTQSPNELFKESDEFYGSIIADFGNANSQYRCANDYNFLKINNNNIYTYAVKIPENGEGIVFRVMNLSCEKQEVNFASDLDFSSYAEVNGMEEKISCAQSFDKSIEFKSYELKTILFEKEQV